MSNVDCEAHLGAVYENQGFQKKTRIKYFPPDSYCKLGSGDSV